MPDAKLPINLDDMDFGHTIRGLQKDDRVFERFVLKRLLGRGGMGVVWLAVDQRLGRDVALKFAPEVVRWDDLAVEELKEETRKGLELAHPNIVKIYDFLLDEEHAAISMEFIDGENLGIMRTRQAGKIFEPPQIAPWVAQLLDALDYAHRGAKVIHRDLKPANLMIDRGGSLRITDFGIARSISDALDRATMGGASTGTLAYMSPQQAAGRKPHVSDDLYAFGSTVYELLTGKPPFFTGNIAQQLSDETPMSIAERRREFGVLGDPLEQSWEDTILACLSKRPEERPASAVEIRSRLGLGAAIGPDSKATVLSSTQAFGTQALKTAPPLTPPVSVPTVSPGPPPMVTNPATASAISVTAPATQPQTQTQPYTEPPRRKSRAGGMLMTLLGIFVVAVAIAGAAVWGYQHYQDEVDRFLLAKLGLHFGSGPTESPQKPDPGKIASNDPGKVQGKDLQKDPTHLKDPRIDPLKIDTTGPAKPVKEDKTEDKKPHEDPAKFTTIQNAINKAKAGDMISIPDGTYDEQIRFKDGVQLQAAPNAKVIVRTDGSTGSALIIENCRSGSITGLVFQHTGGDVVEKASWPVVLMRSSGIVFENNTVQAGVGDGMTLSGSSKPEIRHCVFNNNSKNGLVVESGASANVADCEFRKNGESGLEIRLTGSSAMLTNNTIADNAKSGIVVKDGASASLLQHNKFLINGEAGIAAVGDGVSVAVNAAECDGNVFGILVLDGAKAQITDATIRNSKRAGIHFDSPAEGTGLSNTLIEKSIMAGVEITGGTGVTVTLSGNKSNLNGTSGIAVYGPGFKPRLNHNEAHNNGQYGILVAEGCSGELRDNVARDNILAGIGQFKAAPDLVLQANDADQGMPK